MLTSRSHNYLIQVVGGQYIKQPINWQFLGEFRSSVSIKIAYNCLMQIKLVFHYYFVLYIYHSKCIHIHNAPMKRSFFCAHSIRSIRASFDDITSLTSMVHSQTPHTSRRLRIKRDGPNTRECANRCGATIHAPRARRLHLKYRHLALALARGLMQRIYER